MPYIITSKTRSYRDTKPPVGSTLNWGHPLSKGLVGCWMMNEGGGNLVNDIASKYNGTNSGAVWSNQQKGKALKFNGTSDNILIGDKSKLNLTN